MRVAALAGVLLALFGLVAAGTIAAEAPTTEPAPVMQPPPSAAQPATPGSAARPAIPEHLILPGRRRPKPPPPQGGELEGYWTGTWTKFTDPLPVAVTFVKTASGYIGWFESDALQVAHIPFAEVTYREPDVHIVLRGDTTTAVFDGAVSIDTITGTFTEGPAAGTFSLKRGRSPEAGLRAREVSFQNGNVALSGTLILPATAAARYRAVLFMHGSGAEGRWANRYLAQKFAARGVAALIFDKRGVGKSTGDWRTASFEDLAADAAAGIRYLQSQPDIHPANVGIYGHSQGATIAPLVAERVPDLEFIVASAASGLRPERTEEYSVMNWVGVFQLPEAERADALAYVREVVQVGYRGKDRAALDAMAARFRTRSWFFAPPAPGDPYWLFSRKIARYRPLAHWKNVHARVFLIYGERDLRVPANKSLELIRDALTAGNKGQPELRTWMIPDADHTFTLMGSTLRGGWPKRVPDYAERVVNWVMWDHETEDRPYQ